MGWRKSVIDGVEIGKLTRREKHYLRLMDEADKHDSRMTRKDAAAEKKAAKTRKKS